MTCLYYYDIDAYKANCMTHFVFAQVLRMPAFLLDLWKVWTYLIVTILICVLCFFLTYFAVFVLVA